jgi:hypothetical protein
MRLKLLTDIAKYSVASIGGVSLIYSFNKDKIKTVQNSWISNNFQPTTSKLILF